MRILHSRTPRRLAVALACTLAAALAACESPNESTPPETTPPETTPPPATTPPVASKLVIVSGDNQAATAGSEVPGALVVRVTDDRDRPVPGHLVNFRVATGGGTVFAGAAQTDAQGEARERWTLGTSTAAADSQRVEVRAVDASGAARVLAVFRAVARPGGAAQLTIVGAAERAGTAGTVVTPPPSVRVVDRFGNPIPGQAVAWAVTAGGGSVSAASNATDGPGVASVQWTLGTATGTPQALRASVGELAVQFSATTTSGQAATLVKVVGDGGTGNAYTPRVVQVRVADAFGNPVAGQPVTWTAESAGVRFTQATTLTDALGYATNDWFLGAPGAQQARASVANGPSAVFTATAVARLTRLATPQAQDTVGKGVGISLRVVGPDGRGIPQIRLTFTVTSGGGSVSEFATVPSVSFETGQNGEASLKWVLGPRPGANTLRVTAVDGVTGSPQEFVVNAVAGPASQLRFRTQPSNVRSGQLMTPPVEVETLDRFGNLVLSHANPVMVQDPGIEGGRASAPVVNGVATFPNLRGRSTSASPEQHHLAASSTGTFGFMQPFYATSAPFTLFP